MKILLVSPTTPETFWSFKHVLRFRLQTQPSAAGPSDRGCDAPRRLAGQAGGRTLNPLSDDDLARADFVLLAR